VPCFEGEGEGDEEQRRPEQPDHDLVVLSIVFEGEKLDVRWCCEDVGH
jgi:hypothetical protein